MSKKKERIGVMFSTNPNFQYEHEEEEEQVTLEPKNQLLYVSIDRKQRGGKEVTLVEGFVGTQEDLETLGKQLKNKCGVGGTAKDHVIMIQGSFKDKIALLLEQMGYKVKKKGGN